MGGKKSKPVRILSRDELVKNNRAKKVNEKKARKKLFMELFSIETFIEEFVKITDQVVDEVEDYSVTWVNIESITCSTDDFVYADYLSWWELHRWLMSYYIDEDEFNEFIEDAKNMINSYAPFREAGWTVTSIEITGTRDNKEFVNWVSGTTLVHAVANISSQRPPDYSELVSVKSDSMAVTIDKSTQDGSAS